MDIYGLISTTNEYFGINVECYVEEKRKFRVKRKISCTKNYQRNRILIKIRNQLKKKYKKVREEE